MAVGGRDLSFWTFDANNVLAWADEAGYTAWLQFTVLPGGPVFMGTLHPSGGDAAEKDAGESLCYITLAALHIFHPLSTCTFGVFGCKHRSPAFLSVGPPWLMPQPPRLFTIHDRRQHVVVTFRKMLGANVCASSRFPSVLSHE